MRERPSPQEIPDEPGAYQFLDPEGRTLYVGKAKSLRHRLANYFGDPGRLASRTREMVDRADRVEWTVVGTEVEALVLEHGLIQAHQPRYNIRLKDDKSYPWLAVTVGEQWPRPSIVRGQQRKGVKYFGPFGHVKALRETLDLLVRSFPVRSCSDSKFKSHERLGRPCLLFDIERCSGPCIGAVGADEYGAMLDDLMGFLRGHTKEVTDRLRSEMLVASEHQDYEHAGRLRDRLVAVEKAGERQELVSERRESFDVIGMSEDNLEVAVVVLHIREGRVVGRRGSTAEKVEEIEGGELLARVLEDFYGSSSVEVPGLIVVGSDPGGRDTLESWLVARRGGPVELRMAKRGRKRLLLETAERNARDDLGRQRLRRAGDHASRAKALVDLQERLGLGDAPLRIECFDMSHLQGTDYVGSMVVFEDGLAKRSDYRRFKVKSVEGNDDYAAMAEVLGRRLDRLLEDRARPAEDRRGRFRYQPDLIVVDGGKGQLGVAIKAVAAAGLTEEIELAALAKEFEEVFRPGSSVAIRIPRGAESLYLLQRLRDEAHRFAIGYHRERRGKRMKASVLDEIRGLGPARRKRLLAELGGMTKVKQVTREDLENLTWLPSEVAEDLLAAVGVRQRDLGETVER